MEILAYTGGFKEYVFFAIKNGVVDCALLPEDLHNFADNKELVKFVQNFHDLSEILKFDDEDINKIAIACAHSHFVHKGQERKYENLPYISHILRVSSFFIGLAVDICKNDSSIFEDRKQELIDAIVACFMHDSVEDRASVVSGTTDADRSDALGAIEKLYGASVRAYVNVLSKPDKGYMSKDDNYQNWIEHIWDSGDLFSILIKFADLHDNLSSTIRVYESADPSLFYSDAEEYEMNEASRRWLEKYKKAILSLKEHLDNYDANCPVCNNEFIRNILRKRLNNVLADLDKLIF